VPPLEAERRLGAATYTHGVDAAPLLAQIAHHLQRLHFDVVLIGNAAAALQGAPVTTVDFDFMFRKTPVSLRKLKALAKALGATVLRPYYPASDLFRVVRDDDGLQLDFMADVHGVRSLAGLRARATPVDLGGSTLLVASLADIIKSKRAARRPRDLAVLDVLERTHDEKKRAAEDARRPPARKRPRAR
jgi:predicted nucleotidyltransferase